MKYYFKNYLPIFFFLMLLLLCFFSLWFSKWAALLHKMYFSMDQALNSPGLPPTWKLLKSIKSGQHVVFLMFSPLQKQNSKNKDYITVYWNEDHQKCQIVLYMYTHILSWFERRALDCRSESGHLSFRETNFIEKKTNWAPKKSYSIM